jgi:hypothetical protein
MPPSRLYSEQWLQTRGTELDSWVRVIKPKTKIAPREKVRHAEMKVRDADDMTLADRVTQLAHDRP